MAGNERCVKREEKGVGVKKHLPTPSPYILPCGGLERVVKEKKGEG